MLYDSSILWDTGNGTAPVQLLEIETTNGILVINHFDLTIPDVEYTYPELSPDNYMSMLYSHIYVEGISNFEFYDSTKLILVSWTSRHSLTHIINTDTFNITFFAQGDGESFSDKKDEGILVKMQKHYDLDESIQGGGAYWVDKLYGIEGSFLKFISPLNSGGECVPVRKLINRDSIEYPPMQQKPNECIYVWAK